MKFFLWFIYRSRVLPPLTFSILCKIGLLGLIGYGNLLLMKRAVLFLLKFLIIFNLNWSVIGAGVHLRSWVIQESIWALQRLLQLSATSLQLSPSSLPSFSGFFKSSPLLLKLHNYPSGGFRTLFIQPSQFTLTNTDGSGTSLMGTLQHLSIYMLTSCSLAHG